MFKKYKKNKLFFYMRNKTDLIKYKNLLNTYIDSEDIFS